MPNLASKPGAFGLKLDCLSKRERLARLEGRNLYFPTDRSIKLPAALQIPRYGRSTEHNRGLDGSLSVSIITTLVIIYRKE